MSKSKWILSTVMDPVDEMDLSLTRSGGLLLGLPVLISVAVGLMSRLIEVWAIFTFLALSL